MSQHPSLKSDTAGAKFRSVLKRFERVKDLAEKEKWEEDKDSVYNLPKVKRILFKTKKTKGPEEEEGENKEETPAAEAPKADKKS